MCYTAMIDPMIDYFYNSSTMTLQYASKFPLPSDVIAIIRSWKNAFLKHCGDAGVNKPTVWLVI
jgi:hypothetical protein